MAVAAKVEPVCLMLLVMLFHSRRKAPFITGMAAVFNAEDREASAAAQCSQHVVHLFSCVLILLLQSN